ncbi:MAG: hypothetical protein JXA13_06430 [Anaerolineales bacterium]|nr:hypothetical protein [Anaerolineales bacterium]
MTFTNPVDELEPFALKEEKGEADLLTNLLPTGSLDARVLVCQTMGWVGGKQRLVEIWSAKPGLLLTVEESSYYLAPDGRSILAVDLNRRTGRTAGQTVSNLYKDVLLGPALVLALAMRGVWSLHASAVFFEDKGMYVFLGESGAGKSTLAAFLGAGKNSDWKLAADDILPAAMQKSCVYCWPHYPQLKAPLGGQPGTRLPESLEIYKILMIVPAKAADSLEVEALPARQRAPVIIGHTAGTRMFPETLLGKHLEFCARVSEQIPVYRLRYPHRESALTEVRDVLTCL